MLILVGTSSEMDDLELSLAESELIGGAAARVNPVSYTFTAGRCTITSTGVEDWNKMQSIPTGTTISCRP